jgi:hypothetical protein
MAGYHFLCPKCGRGFLEGTGFTKCPECQVPLLEAGQSSTPDLRKLPHHLDVAALMRQVLAEQQPQESIDAVITRVIERNYPESAVALKGLIDVGIAAEQSLRGRTRQEAAQELAESQSELDVGPDGKPIVRAFHSEINLEGIPADQRAEVEKQIQEALKSGKPFSEVKIILNQNKPKAGCLSLLLMGMLVALSLMILHGQ